MNSHISSQLPKMGCVGPLVVASQPPAPPCRCSDAIMPDIVPFPDAAGDVPALGEVGGKGLSLWRMSSIKDLQVPSGFVLTMPFFAHWFESLKAQPCWQEMLAACKGYDPDDQASVQGLHAACQASKAACSAMMFTEMQQQRVAAALDVMCSEGAKFVAVRSSSPEEDLAGMSFAGGYETLLGVKAEVGAIEAAVRKVFVSCLDERVFVYKMSHGIADLTPRIAVVVQRQVAAKVAGVAFSLDPISNCYDWATVTTNWGLGETVVSGQCSPDQFLVNKVTHRTIRRELGKKEVAVWLGPDGGVYEEAGPAAEFTLSEAEVAMVTRGLVALEQFYGHPLDTEFALDEHRRLLWLQARPITTHIELPRQITTEPGHPEVLWLDVMQIVQGFTDLASTAGLSLLSVLFTEGALPVALGLASKRATIYNRPFTVVPEAGVFYMNASFILRHVGWARRALFAEKLELMDFNVAKVIRELDDSSLVRSASWYPLPLLVGWNLPGLPANVLKNERDLPTALRRADDAHAGLWRLVYELHELRGHAGACAEKGAFQERDRASDTSEFVGAVHVPPAADVLAAHARAARGWFGGGGPAPPPHIVDVAQAVLPLVVRTVLTGLVASVVSAVLVLRKARGMFDAAPEDVRAALEDVTQGTPSVTAALSERLEDVAEALERGGGAYDLPRLRAGVAAAGEGLPAEAWAAWQTVMAQFGHRGVGELDMAAPRYREEPELLLEQVLSIMTLPKEARPRGLAAAAVRKREAAVERLSAWLSAGGGDAELFRSRVQHYHALFRYRESPKYLIIKLVDLCRREVMAQAEGLVRAGRLDAPGDVWALTLHDLRAVRDDAGVDVRALVQDRRAYRDRNAHARWPKVVTSRGRTLRPKPSPAKEGEVAGHAVSPGVAVGRVKVLRAPREKPLLTGEVLVTKATDPGWTPLFVPAAAVLLEVGGALQHGALVAREFGKPCVAGIEDVMDKFRDGMLVEVDGTEGVVRILDEGQGSQ